MKPHLSDRRAVTQPVSAWDGDDWRTRAACTLDNTALFAPPEGKDYEQTARRISEAKAFCRQGDGCPVRAECLTYGRRQRLDGVFGGELLSVGRIARYDPQPGQPQDVCGTPSGYKRHRYRKQEPCKACKHAHAIAETNRRNHRRGAA